MTAAAPFTPTAISIYLWAAVLGLSTLASAVLGAVALVRWARR